MTRGVVAAGHIETARAGAEVLREGGNAVDAALAAMLASWVAEPLLTGPGAGGLMLVAPHDGEPVVLDFFTAAPGEHARGEDLVPVDVSFGDAVQQFHVGRASVAVPGTPSGIAHAARRFGTLPLADLAAPAAALARGGVTVNAQQAFVAQILEPILQQTRECAALLLIDGRPPRPGEVQRFPALAETIERLGRDGDAPFYTGDLARAIVEAAGHPLAHGDLTGYRTEERAPARARFRGRDVLTTPPPSAGGILIAHVLERLDRSPPPTSVETLVAAMDAAQDARTLEFTAALQTPGAAEAQLAMRLGATTHISVLDADGTACSVTCTNGEGCGIVVHDTGIHLNNMMGEADLSPFGWFTHPPGARLPTMIAPTVALRDGAVEVVIGSAGSNRIRSAIVQVLLAVCEEQLSAADAVTAPRVHSEDGVVYAEPGIELGGLPHELVRFRAPNLYFGGVHLVRRAPDGSLEGGGDPRRGGAVAVV